MTITLRQKLRPEDEVRFWSKVATPVGPSECWNWTDAIGSMGYGVFHLSRHITNGARNVSAHRVSYTLCVGDIPEGMVIDHLCRNTRCVNYFHLRVATVKENTHAGIGPAAQNVKKTHCHRGHPLTADNTWVSPKGHRHCKQCNVIKNTAYRQRLREVQSLSQ